jgi:hypothetical protein
VLLRRPGEVVRARPAALLRWLSTARAYADLRAPGAVPVVVLGKDERGPVLAHAHIAGSDLATLVVERGPMPLALAARTAASIAATLGHAHARGVIHRDLKPHCVLVDAGGRTWVSDFGLGAEGEAELAGAEVPSGLRAYTSPEQVERDRPADARTDIFRLAKLFYHLVTGASPAAVELDTVAPEARPLLKRALSARPEDRPGDIALVREELLRIASVGDARAAAAGRTSECPYCGAEVPLDASVCAACAHRLPERPEGREARRRAAWAQPVQPATETAAGRAPAPARGPVAPEELPPLVIEREVAGAGPVAGERGPPGAPGAPGAGGADPERERAEQVRALWARVREDMAGRAWRRAVAGLHKLRDLRPGDLDVAAALLEAETNLGRSEKHLAGAAHALLEGNLRTARSLAETVILEMGGSVAGEGILARIRELEGPSRALHARLSEAASSGDIVEQARAAEELLALFPEDDEARVILAAARATLDDARRERRRLLVGAAALGAALVLAVVAWVLL